MTDRIAELDAIVLDQHAADPRPEELPIVFLLGAPRTGSTLIYQLLINAFDMFYLSNLINDAFGEHPAVGAVLDHQLNPRESVPYESRYGKTSSPFGPSEGSLVFRNWFGGDHPSQTRSAHVLPGRRVHMIRSLAAMRATAGRAILIKNAWNCFRIGELARLLPRSAFIWVRRDIEAAAVSDLESRYAHGSPDRWNSATTANYRDIQQRPYWEQVVEQQYEYNRAIDAGLRSIEPARSIDLWYEDVCANPTVTLDRCEALLRSGTIEHARRPLELPPLRVSNGPPISADDRAKIHDYVQRHASDRFSSHLRAVEPAAGVSRA